MLIDIFLEDNFIIFIFDFLDFLVVYYKCLIKINYI